MSRRTAAASRTAATSRGRAQLHHRGAAPLPGQVPGGSGEAAVAGRLDLDEGRQRCLLRRERPGDRQQGHKARSTSA
eukprot:9559429-Alexandrium_andersonii.AAC.1